MARRRRGRQVHGILLLDKPAGVSSNAALQRARRCFDARKAGHTGTLDPFATGMLPLCFGEATKFAGQLLNADKLYLARARLGVATRTGDPEGEVVSEAPVDACSEARLRQVLDGFLGEIEQTPPMYSALKSGGRRLHELAREGREVERAPRRVTIHALELLAADANTLTLRIRCSKGTYVRVLVEDLARALGTVGHTLALRREGVFPFFGAEMVALERLEAMSPAEREAQLLPVDAALSSWPRVELDPRGSAAFRHGQRVLLAAGAGPGGDCRVYDSGGVFLGIGERSGDGALAPRRLVALEDA